MPLFYCLADYAENWTLVESLQAYPNIPYRLARRASFLTAAKSQLIVAVGRHCRRAGRRGLGHSRTAPARPPSAGPAATGNRRRR